MSANYRAVGLQFTEVLGKELAKFLCGSVAVTEPEGLRARPTPQARHEEDAPIVGRILGQLVAVARSATV